MPNQSVIQSILDKIDEVLLGWEETQMRHNITARMIAEGAEILKEARREATGN